MKVCFKSGGKKEILDDNLNHVDVCFFILQMLMSENKMMFVHVYFREGNEPGDELTVTYRELLQRVCQFANVLKSQGRFELIIHT